MNASVMMLSLFRQCTLYIMVMCTVTMIARIHIEHKKAREELRQNNKKYERKKSNEQSDSVRD